MNTFLCPEASADGTEELSCGPTARRGRNDGEILHKKSGEERRPHNCVKFRYFTLSLRGLRRTFTLTVSHRADSRISKISQ